jgi:hypothetical protein
MAASTKHLQIDKANTTVVAFVGIAAFLTAFSLVASKALLNQRSYQARVITEKTKALKQLKENNASAKQLVTSYQGFVGEPINIIGGNPAGVGDRDGDNAKIVLDALPSKYDFPALATSMEKLLNSAAYKINSITGTDDEVAQSQQDTGATTPQPVEMPFEISVTGNFTAIQNLFNTLQQSIRPMHVLTIELSGSDNTLTANIKAKSYYQPEKTLGITTKVVK